MKTATLLSTMLLGLGVSAQAALYSSTYNSGFANSGNVPDGNLTGWSDTRTLSGIADHLITSVSVTLNLSGGFNGDLYAYLSFNGGKTILLNRVGVGTGSEPTYSFGFSGSGYSGLVLSDSGSGNVHDYNGTGPGTYLADGRDVSPVVNSSGDATALYGTSQGTFAGAFNGMNPNGAWTLFFADASSGGGTSQIVSWSLDITAVPEPVNVALGVFGVVFVGVAAARRRRARAKVQV